MAPITGFYYNFSYINIIIQFNFHAKLFFALLFNKKNVHLSFKENNFLTTLFAI